MKSNSKKDLISLIVPSYNEEEAVELFIKEIELLKKDMDYVDFEVIFVDDGSCDNTLVKLRDLAKKYKYVKYISFAKNYGKEYAMIAGFDYALGDYVTVIDADLQHPPKLLKEMYNIVKNEGYDCAAAKSVKRDYSFVRSNLTKIYYKLINAMTEVEMRSSATDYRLMNRKMLNALISHREHNRYLKGIFEITGFKVKWIEYEDNERVAGSTKWNLKKLFKYAITGIISFSQFPLMFILYLGIFLAFISIGLAITLVVFLITHASVNYLFWGLLLVVIALSSLTLCSNGVLGLYIAQIQTESKNRPLYIIKEDNVS